ncbi:radical SAM/Cys-rich domain protein [Leptospira langatensis]|uniref:Radical SAM/Cys-rich domain protein n=1 Tax=Leptospira langatensis TaxID=2484983 RepID=A0A5F1ZW99_9LEPT|nr:arsenosugar biosynthesis radical SAM (seleno)protein ArsS [Leptospira langatensis]TGJ98307.1 radical SAM/Cys-rich domain protein [Leptospira langatensis]TGL43221.1 radical SAM/Cys-rich domain protein [Leptospira langatensis]
MKSLLARGSELASPKEQLRILSEVSSRKGLPLFEEKLQEIGSFPLRPTGIDILQVNVGKLCNQSCKHCHVDAAPDRKEVMSKETMQECLVALASPNITTLDITGGAPEMNPNFKWFVEEASKLGKKILVRCNLTIVLAGEKYRGLPEFFAKHRVEVISSLPYFQKRRTDAQRGEGVFDRSVQALQKLNEIGYGIPGSGLILNLVYNPGGAFLPGGQSTLESDFKRELKQHFGVEFNSLFALTNMPISRFLEFLLESGNLDSYLEKLVTTFNPSAAAGVMCRNTLSVGWDGSLYDCDFNQMLDMQLEGEVTKISDFNQASLDARAIRLEQHCYGCTAGAGSSCGGSLA